MANNLGLEKAIYTKAYSEFASQRRSAEIREIDWNITFEEWYIWWQETRHYHERGRLSNEYCMSRFNDEGPYSIDNIECKTNFENAQENAIRQGRDRGRNSPSAIKKRTTTLKKRIENGEYIPPNRGKTNIEMFGEEKAKEISEKILAGFKKDEDGKRIGNPSPHKGKTAEEIYGVEEAARIKKQASESRKGKQSKLKGIAKPTTICPHCNKEGAIAQMGRWHFDNCKLK